MNRNLVIASGNLGKLREIESVLSPLGYTLTPQSHYSIPEAEEPHPTFIENSIAKARHAARLSGIAALADDSGLCVDALGGAPGVHSARYAGDPRSDSANNAKLIAALRGVPQRNAYYYCVVVYLRHADDPQPLIAEGRWHGQIIDDARGTNGFGYDPHFFIPQLGRTAAELERAEKNARSHRGLALANLATQLA